MDFACVVDVKNYTFNRDNYLGSRLTAKLKVHPLPDHDGAAVFPFARVQ
jgi:hypothetical protein